MYETVVCSNNVDSCLAFCSMFAEIQMITAHISHWKRYAKSHGFLVPYVKRKLSTARRMAHSCYKASLYLSSQILSPIHKHLMFQTAE
jgi:hypothetical protein